MPGGGHFVNAVSRKSKPPLSRNCNTRTLLAAKTLGAPLTPVDESSEDAIVSELGKLIGLPTLTLDEDRQCTLSFDPDLLISIKAGDPVWMLVAPLADLSEYLLTQAPNQGENESLQNLLATNLLLALRGAGQVCLDRESDSVLLIRSIPSGYVTSTDLCAAIEDFVATLESMREAMNTDLPPAGEAPPSSEYRSYDLA